MPYRSSPDAPSNFNSLHFKVCAYCRTGHILLDCEPLSEEPLGLREDEAPKKSEVMGWRCLGIEAP